MSLSNTHPLYDQFIEMWQLIEDSFNGSKAIKDNTEKYLPPTCAMYCDGYGKQTNSVGGQNYAAYLKRAVYPELIAEAVSIMMGLLHQKEATFELPAKLEYLINDATVQSEGLNELLRRINLEQLKSGRLGLLLDVVVTEGKPQLYIATYNYKSIINWDDSDDHENKNELEFVVLNESGWVRNQFTWKMKTKYRVLEKRDNTYYNGSFLGETYDEGSMVTPSIFGSTLKEIPFVFINSADITPNPTKPILMSLAEDCLTIYRGEADYRQNLFMQGQDTLVIKGDIVKEDTDCSTDTSIRVGAGSVIHLEQADGDAKYIGVNSQGLSEQREALTNDYKRAYDKSGNQISSMTGSNESGEALKIRMTAQTATLNEIALTSAAALEKVLKIAARWVGADPNEVKVTPNLEFVNYDLSGAEIVSLMTARNTGAPLSLQSIHKLLVDKGLTKLSYEEEVKSIQDEINSGANLI